MNATRRVRGLLLSITPGKKLKTRNSRPGNLVSSCLIQVHLGLKRLIKKQRKLLFKRLMRGLLRLLGRVRSFLNSLSSRQVDRQVDRAARAMTAWALREPTPIQRVLSRW